MSTVGADVFLFLAGLVLLILGSNSLIKYSLIFSQIFRISSLLVGLVIVAFGTSLPEAAVSIVASFKGQSGIAFGNLIGSNIANLGLVLGAAGLVRPLQVDKGLFRREIPAMLFLTLLTFVFSLDLEISRGEGVALLLCFAAFVFTSWQGGRQTSPPPSSGGRLKTLLFIGLALAVVVGGAELMVKSGVLLADYFKISPWVVGMSVFAIGTSLPELAASVTAAYKKSSSLSLGNVIGSNVFNLSLVLGLASVIRPLHIAPQVLKFELLFLLLMSLAFFVFTRTRRRLERWEAASLLLLYGLFIKLVAGSF